MLYKKNMRVGPEDRRALDSGDLQPVTRSKYAQPE